MELADFTPISQDTYMLLENHTFEGQTRVVDNHSWSCWKTACGRLVRIQAQNVPDSLLEAEDLVVSNKAIHFYESPYQFILVKGKLEVPTHEDLDSAWNWMRANSEADCGSDSDVWHNAAVRSYEQRLKDEQIPAVMADEDLPFVSYERSFCVEYSPKYFTPVKVQFVREDHKKSTYRDAYYGFRVVVNGKNVNGVTCDPANMALGLVDALGYSLGSYYQLFPAEIAKHVLSSIGAAIEKPEHVPGTPFVETQYELMDSDYTRQLSFVCPSNNWNKAMANIMGYRHWQKFKAAGFDSDTSFIFGMAQGKLDSMGSRRGERNEVLALLGLSDATGIAAPVSEAGEIADESEDDESPNYDEYDDHDYESPQRTPEARYCVDFSKDVPSNGYGYHNTDIAAANAFVTELTSRGFAFTNAYLDEFIDRYGLFHVNPTEKMVMVDGPGGCDWPMFLDGEYKTSVEVLEIIDAG